MGKLAVVVATGAAAAIGTLVAKPEAYAWLRRRIGLETEDRKWFENEIDDDLPDAPGDEPMDTHAARMSLRARLQDAPEPVVPRDPVVQADDEPALSTPRPERADLSQMRARIDEARERVHATARDIMPPPAPGEITEPIE